MKTKIVAIIITIFGMMFQIPVQMTCAPIECSTKTYGDYRAVTNTASNQYKLLQTLDVGDDGMLRDEDGYIAAALGSYFGEIGSRWWFFLDSGKIIPVIKVDEKQNQHTIDSWHTVGVNYDIIEFYIDSTKFTKASNGYVWSGNFNNCTDYEGAVIGWKEIKNEQ